MKNVIILFGVILKKKFSMLGCMVLCFIYGKLGDYSKPDFISIKPLVMELHAFGKCCMGKEW